MFAKPTLLKRHSQRKTPCSPILTDDDIAEELRDDPALEDKKCRFCGRVFATYTSMRRHVRDTCKIAPNARNGTAGMELLYEHTVNRQNAAIEGLQSDMTKMLELMRGLAGPAPAAASVRVQASGQATVAVDNRQLAIDARKNKVVINVFGQESVGHITREMVRDILDQALTMPGLTEAAHAAILAATLVIFSEAEHQENVTCFLPNKKTDDVLVHGAKGWEAQPVSRVIPPMAEKALDVMFDRQPMENSDKYGPLMRVMANDEPELKATARLRTVLIRNKGLIRRAGALPEAGTL